MTEVRIEGAQSYIIPLESIDLTYLSKYVQCPKVEKLPLWSRRNLDGESQYYEVKMVVQDVNEDCYFEEQSDTYKCHVCNVHVPVMCSKEHNESGKHETLKKIFDQVFERVSKQINNVTISNEKNLNKDEYYCVPCSKIVKKENKYRHNSSNYHIKSQEDINCVNEFYKIFKGNNSNDDDDKTEANEEHSDTESDISTNNYYSSTEDIVNDTANNTTEKDLINDYKSTTDDTISSIKKHAMQPTNLIVESFKSKNNCDKKLSFEEKKTSIDNNTNKQYMNMLDENKIKINNKNYFCDLCKLNLPVNKLDDHINDSSHVARLSESTSVQELVFCKLCNVNIPADKLEYHNAGTPHWSNAFNNICIGLTEGLQTFFSKDNTKTDNVSSENKKDNQITANTSVCDVISYKADPSRPFRIAADPTKNIVTCLICDVDIANNETLIIEHEKSKNHNMSVENLLDFHTIIKKSRNNYFCKCCNVKLLSGFFIHIGLVKHTALLQIKYVLNKRSLNLYIYKVTVRNSDAIMYRELYKKLLSVNKINKLMDSRFYCTICEIHLNAGNEIGHLLGARHTEWLINAFKC